MYQDRFSFYSAQKVELTTGSAQELSLLSVRGVHDEANITLEQHLIQRGYHFQREYIFDSFTTVKRMAMEGLGIAILPRRMVSKENNLSLIRAKGFNEAFGTHRIYATVSPHRENDRRIKTLVTYLKKQLSIK